MAPRWRRSGRRTISPAGQTIASLPSSTGEEPAIERTCPTAGRLRGLRRPRFGNHPPGGRGGFAGLGSVGRIGRGGLASARWPIDHLKGGRRAECNGLLNGPLPPDLVVAIE